MNKIKLKQQEAFSKKITSLKFLAFVIVLLFCFSPLENFTTNAMASLRFGPVEAVESEVDDLEEAAEEHWQEIYYKNNCNYDPEPEDCADEAGIPTHVIDHWFDDTETRNEMNLEGRYYLNLTYDTEPLLGDGCGVYGGTVKFVDFSGNDTDDLALSGIDADNNYRLSLHKNHGGAFHSEPDTEPLKNHGDGLEQSAFLFADFSGDSKLDMAVAGRDSNRNERMMILENQAGFSDVDGAEKPLKNNDDGTGVWDASLAAGDMTGNGVPNLVVSGRDINDSPQLIIYHKDKYPDTYATHWQPMADTGGGLWGGDLALGNFTGRYEDLTRVGYKDLIASGRTGLPGDGQPKLNLYDTRRSDSPAELDSPFEEGLWFSALDLADFTGNNRLDLAAAGLDNNDQPRLLLFENTGGGDFVLLDEPLDGDGGGLSGADLQLGDLTGNGYPDLVAAGRDANYQPRLIVFVNEGNGNFEKYSEPLADNPELEAEGLWSASVSLGDYTGDGRLDLAASGSITYGHYSDHYYHLNLEPRLYLFKNPAK